MKSASGILAFIMVLLIVVIMLLLLQTGMSGKWVALIVTVLLICGVSVLPKEE